MCTSSTIPADKIPLYEAVFATPFGQEDPFLAEIKRAGEYKSFKTIDFVVIDRFIR